MFDFAGAEATDLLQKRKRLRRELLEAPGLREVRIAVLGGSTTSEVVDLLELFLLNSGLQPEFYQSDYGRYYEDAVLEPERIKAFAPDLVYIHTHYRNIRQFPSPASDETEMETLLSAEVARFNEIWHSLFTVVGCQVIQNNFDIAPLGSLGSFDSVAHIGQNRFIAELNLAIARIAAKDRRLIIHDIHSIAGNLGLSRWFDWSRWFSYKIVTTPEGSAAIARSLTAIIGVLLGRVKKCLILDLDNTLWGGVIGDDGPDRIQIGRETAVAEAYTAFQQYCLGLRARGVLLAVCSKNDETIAKSGFNHPDSILKLEHFAAFKANWRPKHENIEAIAVELNLGLDSFVFIDDNPAERAIVSAQLPSVSVPDVGSEVSLFPQIIQHQHLFEAVTLSQEDLQRSAQYAGNTARVAQQAKFANYGEYLDSLLMSAEIDSFQPVYLDRITQLIGKSNQFNLTTRRYTYPEVAQIASDPDFIPLYGRLQDVFGDNGLVSAIIGRLSARTLHVDLWIMSCRVLKREMELAMLDELVRRAAEAGATQLVGYYLRTPKNALVKDHYENLGFRLDSAIDDGSASVWTLSVADYIPQSTHIHIHGAEFPASQPIETFALTLGNA